jgi:hypothetical protein
MCLMATATAAATAVTMVAVAGMMTIAVTAMGGGTDNNKLEVAAEEIMAVAKVTSVVTAMATEDGDSDQRTSMLTPTTAY